MVQNREDSPSSEPTTVAPSSLWEVSGEKEPSRNSLPRFPDDVLAQIFSYLSCLEILCLSSLNTYWRSYIRNPNSLLARTAKQYWDKESYHSILVDMFKEARKNNYSYWTPHLIEFGPNGSLIGFLFASIVGGDELEEHDSNEMLQTEEWKSISIRENQERDHPHKAFTDRNGLRKNVSLRDSYIRASPVLGEALMEFLLSSYRELCKPLPDPEGAQFKALSRTSTVIRCEGFNKGKQNLFGQIEVADGIYQGLVFNGSTTSGQCQVTMKDFIPWSMGDYPPCWRKKLMCPVFINYTLPIRKLPGKRLQTIVAERLLVAENVAALLDPGPELDEIELFIDSLPNIARSITSHDQQEIEGARQNTSLTESKNEVLDPRVSRNVALKLIKVIFSLPGDVVQLPVTFEEFRRNHFLESRWINCRDKINRKFRHCAEMHVPRSLLRRLQQIGQTQFLESTVTTHNREESLYFLLAQSCPYLVGFFWVKNSYLHKNIS